MMTNASRPQAQRATPPGPTAGPARAPSPPGPARPWPGLALGVLTAAGLGLARPEAVERLTRLPMLVCHGVTVAALATLLAEALRWRARGRALRRAEADGLADESSWPRALASWAIRGRLTGLYGQTDIDARLDAAAGDVRATSGWRWWPYYVLAFALPPLGFYAGWKDVKANSGYSDLLEAFLPLPVALVEAGSVLAFATALAFLAQTQAERWRTLAGGLLIPRSPLVLALLGQAAGPARASGGGPNGKGGRGGDRDDASDGGDLGGREPDSGSGEIEIHPPMGSMFDSLFDSSSDQDSRATGDVGD